PTTTSSSSSFFIYCHSDPPHLHSFPTRRSSDLARSAAPTCFPAGSSLPKSGSACPFRARARRRGRSFRRGSRRRPSCRPYPSPRSEEHTSELQSPYDLVCRLLLEKKKIQKPNTH